MTNEDSGLLKNREEGFDAFYQSLLPSLVEFVGLLGISPSHAVLTHAPRLLPLVDQATRNLSVESDSDRSWLLARTAYFIGEYFVQKFSGYWFVNATYGSRYFARYVVGGFSVATGEVIDPFEMATVYVDTPATRDLNALIIDVERSWGSV